MKTLYININNEQIQSNEELEVLKHDLDSDFFFYLGEKIAKGCKIENENVLITDFITQENEEDYKQIIAQWNELKNILFSEKCEGEFKFTLPNGYIHWLRYSEKYNHVYDKNFSHGEPTIITIDLEELYVDSVEDLQRKIMRKFQRDDLYLEIDEIVFNDDAVTRKSPIIRAIKVEYESVGFKTYKNWGDGGEEKPRTPPCPTSSLLERLFPINGITIGETSIANYQYNTYTKINDETVKCYTDKDTNIDFIQCFCQNHIDTITLNNGISKIPELWHNEFGFTWATSLHELQYIMRTNQFIEIMNNDLVIIVRIPETQIHIMFSFEDNENLTSIVIGVPENNKFLIFDEALNRLHQLYVIREWILDKSKIKISLDSVARNRINEAIVKAIIELEDKNETEIIIPYIAPNKHIVETLTNDLIKQLCRNKH